MIEEGAYRIDVLTQVSAVTKALQAVALGLLTDHMSHCLAEAAAKGPEEARKRVEEVAGAIRRFVRT